MEHLQSSPPTSTLVPGWLMARELLKKIIIWGLFFTLIYLARDFFFLAFMTFIFSYLALNLVNLLIKLLWPNSDLPGRRRFLTIGIFLCLPAFLLAVGFFVMPHLVAQTQHFIGWASRINPELEVSRMLEGFVSHSEFEQQFGNPQDPRYQNGLAEFQKTGDHYVKQYLDFPNLEAWIEGGFNRQFADSQRNVIRSRLMSKGVTSKEFESWFISVKYPQLKSAIQKVTSDKSTVAVQVDPLVHYAMTASAQDMLQKIRYDLSLHSVLEEEWIKYTVAQELAAAKTTPAYLQQFQKHYDQIRKQKPDLVPYTFDEFITLQNARPHGQRAFGEAIEKLRPSAAKESEAQVKSDFETSMKHELFQKWWNTSSPATFIRHELETRATGNSSERLEALLTALLNIPVDICTALLLSFLICIDFPAMQRAGQRLRETWLRDVYDELVPTLSSLGRLVGTSMYAQGLIALCNAALIYCGLTFIGIEHAAILSFAVFVLCLVPTLGTIIAWVLIGIIALVQPGGGLGLAGKATAVVAIVVVLEIFVFSPRILGKLMEMHPVLIIAILPIAHSFFGIWGLLLAIPVSVYVINQVILRRDVSVNEDEKATSNRVVTTYTQSDQKSE
jgi:predicted PurR-regulated permease PerM